MMRPRLALLGVSKSERHGVVSGVRDAISVAGGWIVDHTQFSNIAIALRFALPPGGHQFSHVHECLPWVSPSQDGKYQCRS